MDDDLGVPAALGVVHDTVTEGNRLLADGSDDLVPALADVTGSVRAMLDVLGVDPYSPPWPLREARQDDALRSVVDRLWWTRCASVKMRERARTLPAPTLCENDSERPASRWRTRQRALVGRWPQVRMSSRGR